MKGDEIYGRKRKQVIMCWTLRLRRTRGNSGVVWKRGYVLGRRAGGDENFDDDAGRHGKEWGKKFGVDRDLSQCLAPPPAPPSFTYLFTVSLNLDATGPPSRIQEAAGLNTISKPSPSHLPLDPGTDLNILTVEPLAAGRVEGPAINASLLPGLAYPSQNAAGTFALPSLLLRGKSDDNETDILISGERIGVGRDGDQWVRLVSFPLRIESVAFDAGFGNCLRKVLICVCCVADYDWGQV
ncbi:MAG: hypothetical protein Q9160_008371 [Pyrenula sp. 1 TL-2023]